MNKARTILELARAMQDSRSGLSLLDIQERFGVARRTAERMRDAVMEIFPRVEQVSTRERIKRWRLAPGAVDGLLAPTPAELTSLDTAITLMRRADLEEQAFQLARLVEKLRSTMKAIRNERP